MKIRIYKSSDVLGAEYYDVEASDDAKVSRVLNGKDEITFKTESETALDTPLGSTLVVGVGIYSRYYMNQLPTYEKISSKIHSYTFVFQSPLFDLEKVAFLDIDDNAEFYYNGTAQDFVKLIIMNLNNAGAAIPSTWVEGICNNTDYKNIQFDNQNCWQAINLIMDEFKFELSVGRVGTSYSISLVEQVGTPRSVSVKYGSGNGLYNIKRTNIDVDKLITRLYYFGSKNNIPLDYPYNRLRGTTNYIEKNVGLYGRRDGIKTFEDVKPSYTGTIASASIIEDGALCEFTDNGFPFDLNERDAEGQTVYLVPGTTAKIHFLTGDCAGITCDIVEDEGYKPNDAGSGGILKIIPYQYENGYKIPNETVTPANGDTFKIIDIMMPDTYVTNASAELDVAANDWLDKYSTPRVQYTLESDTNYFYENDIQLDIGDIITVNDPDLSITENCRVVELSFNLFDRFKQTIILSDVRFAMPERAQKMFQSKLKTAVIANKLADVDKINRTQKTSTELKNRVFEQKKYYSSSEQNIVIKEHFIPENNRPESLDPYMLALDSGEIQFSLKSATIEPNVGADPLAVNVGEGELIHHSYFGKTRAEIDKLKENEEDYDPTRIWNIAEQTLEATDPAAGYYVYAKIPLAEIETAATIVLDTEHIVAKRDIEFNTETKKVEGYIHYKLGYLSEVVNNKRTLNQLWSESGSDKTFEHEQATPADVWTIEHKLGKCPAVTVIDTAGSVVEGKIDIIDINRVQLTFNAAFSGKAYFN